MSITIIHRCSSCRHRRDTNGKLPSEETKYRAMMDSKEPCCTCGHGLAMLNYTKNEASNHKGGVQDGLSTIEYYKILVLIQ